MSLDRKRSPRTRGNDEVSYFFFFCTMSWSFGREEPCLTSEKCHLERDVSRVSLHLSFFLLLCRLVLPAREFASVPNKHIVHGGPRCR